MADLASERAETPHPSTNVGLDVLNHGLFTPNGREEEQ